MRDPTVNVAIAEITEVVREYLSNRDALAWITVADKVVCASEEQSRYMREQSASITSLSQNIQEQSALITSAAMWPTAKRSCQGQDTAPKTVRFR
jgi:hypothetical protein